MVLELIALIDYIELVVKHNEPDLIHNEPIETIYVTYSDQDIIAQLDLYLRAGSFQEVVNIIAQFKIEHVELLRIYEAIEVDYQQYKDYLSDEDLSSKLENDFGIKHPDEVMAILKSKDFFLIEHF